MNERAYVNKFQMSIGEAVNLECIDVLPNQTERSVIHLVMTEENLRNLSDMLVKVMKDVDERKEAMKGSMQ
jgi:hypothetical protein